jgi:type I restriction enzyme M protein
MTFAFDSAGDQVTPTGFPALVFNDSFELSPASGSDARTSSMSQGNNCSGDPGRLSPPVTVAASKKATLAEFLPDLSRDRLKELCRSLDLDDSGRDKAALVERLIGTAGKTEPKKPSSKDSTPARTSTPPEPPSARKPAKKNGGDLGFEATLWQAADKLRNNLDAAEYKHVVLGLIFLKYISDAFAERHKQLELAVEDGADPEDPDEYRANNVFWVPPDSRWEEIKSHAKKVSNGETIDKAMAAIEAGNTSLKGVLPKNYARPFLDKQSAVVPARYAA